jgi:hypothetical protein
MRSLSIKQGLFVISGALTLLCSACGHHHHHHEGAGQRDNDDGGAGSNTVHITTSSSGTVTPGTYPFKVCNTQIHCDMGGPACSHKPSNYCLCNVGQESNGACRPNAGVCVWQVNPEESGCACIPGSTQPCAGGTTKRTCDSEGKRWTSCS